MKEFESIQDRIERERKEKERDREYHIGDLERKIRNLEKCNSDLLEDYESLKKQVRSITDIESQKITIPVIEPITPKNTGEATAWLLTGDWHPYEIVKKSQVNGLNEYNPEVCKSRIYTMWRSFLRLVEIDRAGQNIPRCVVSLLGDVIGNMIRLSKVETNAGTPQEEELFVIFDLMIPGFEYLLENGNFEKIYVYCSHGNHDRGTEKIQYDNMALHSHAWVVYNVVKRYFENSKYADKIEFHIAEGYHLYFNFYDSYVRQHHGDAIRYNGGIGGPTISIKRSIAQWNEGKSLTPDTADLGVRKADYDVFGHLHTTLGDNSYAACPSVIGYTPFSISNKFPYERPSQRYLLVDKKRWITTERKVLLGDK